jgi:hypothetical protein
MPEKQVRSSFTLMLLPVCMILVNCRVAEKNTQDKKAKFEALVKSELGHAYQVSNNTLQTYALCQQERAGDHLRRNFRYIVVRLSDNKIVHKGSFRMGYVQWHDENSIEVSGASSARDNGDSGEKTIIPIRSGQL